MAPIKFDGDEVKINNRDLFDYLKSKRLVAKSNTEPVNKELTEYVQEKYLLKDVALLEKSIKSFTSSLVSNWKKHSGCIHRFTKGNPNWFDIPFKIGEEIKEEIHLINEKKEKAGSKRNVKDEEDKEEKYVEKKPKVEKKAQAKKIPTPPMRTSSRNKK